MITKYLQKYENVNLFKSVITDVVSLLLVLEISKRNIEKKNPNNEDGDELISNDKIEQLGKMSKLVNE